MLSQEQKFRIKQMIKTLSSIRSDDSLPTSMITLTIRDGYPLSEMMKTLIAKESASSNIKSTSNRKSVQEGYRKVIGILKSYKQTPKNGLVVFVGEGYSDYTHKIESIRLNYIPPLKITQNLCRCDSKFHPEFLSKLIQNDDTFACVIVDGESYIVAKITSTERTILASKQVSLPKKHNKGGQSAARFQRLRQEAISAYITKILEVIMDTIVTDGRLNVKGILLGGVSDKKYMLFERLPDFIKDNVISQIDLSYGGMKGLEYTITESKDIIQNNRLVQEKKIIQNYFELIAKDEKYVFGFKDILYAMEAGAVDTLIIWEDNPAQLYMYKNKENQQLFSYDTLLPEEDASIVETQHFVDWILDSYRGYGVRVLELVSDSTSEGVQFMKGFGGIGGIMRYDLEIDQEIFTNEESDGDDFI